MKIIQVYLAHALTQAPETFRKSMRCLRNSLEEIEPVYIMEFAWKDGGPRHDVNVFKYDMDRVGRAHLMVAIADEASVGLGMEILERARLKRPLLCFVHEDIRISKIIPDCLSTYREDCDHEILPEPIRYRNVGEIVCVVRSWVDGYKFVDK